MNSEQFALLLSILCDNTYKVTPANNRKAPQKNSEIEEVPSDCLVSEWLVSSLTNRNSQIATAEQFPRITKKIRDEVVKLADEEVFRRSGFWTATKVFLQLALQNEYGDGQGKVYYKTIMLQLMCNLSRIWLRPEIRRVDEALAMQMMAKMARRVEKLSEIAGEHAEFTEATKNDVLKTINQIHAKIDLNFQNIINMNQIRYQPLEDLKIKKFVHLEMKTVSEYIEKRLENEYQRPANDNEPKHDRIVRHRKSNQEFPGIRQLKDTSGEDELSILLIDIEQWVHANLNYGSESAANIRELATTYGDKAKAFYTGDPIGGSRMILCLLKIIRVLDEKAIRTHNLFKEHRPGVDTKFIDELLLPKRSDLEYARELKGYFRERVAASNNLPGLLDEEVGLHSCFWFL